MSVHVLVLAKRHWEFEHGERPLSVPCLRGHVLHLLLLDSKQVLVEGEASGMSGH